MSSPVEVRSLQKLDHDCWLDLWAGYNAFYGREGATALPCDITAMTWQRFFDPYEPVHALIAVRDDTPLGFAHFLLHRNTTAIEPSVYLQDLFTDQSVREQGIGRTLIEAVYERARTLGCGRVYWQTHETNKAAMRLYDGVADKSGFLVYRKLL